MFGRTGSSPIDQQLAKVLLANEANRGAANKVKEAFYALALEFYESKDQILTMYANAAYFGNQARGLNEAAQTYFQKSPATLSKVESAQLIVSISSPQDNNPSWAQNQTLAARYVHASSSEFIAPARAGLNAQNRARVRPAYFEAKSLSNAAQSCQLSLDQELNEKIRAAVKNGLASLQKKFVSNAAVVAIKLPANELIGLVGTPNPASQAPGYQINLALSPRAIGSTVKPFIYVKAFEKGLRPYTIVDDKEYKYITALGYPLYPKNFDYQYRGLVTLHYALSNSLNVPAVKVLEYVGQDNFDNFLTKNLDFKPVQPIAQYQLGIALGALEMPLLDLARFFTIFPNLGEFKPLKIGGAGCLTPLGPAAPQRVVAPHYVELVNKILSDRRTGVEQFSLASDLNLPFANYALKTGTSRDYRDSWVIGYTPDFLVGVWVGNADLSPTDNISGQKGAGRIWADVMNLLNSSAYSHKTQFNFDDVTTYQDTAETEFGLKGDDFAKIKNQLLQGAPADLITFPHDGDTILFEPKTEIALEASEPVKWFIDGQHFADGAKTYLKPAKVGVSKIKAQALQGSQAQEISIFLVN